MTKQNDIWTNPVLCCVSQSACVRVCDESYCVGQSCVKIQRDGWRDKAGVVEGHVGVQRLEVK